MTEKPILWLIRVVRTGETTSSVMYGKMFMSEETAKAAAVRLTSHSRTCFAFPVFNPTPEQLASLGTKA